MLNAKTPGSMTTSRLAWAVAVPVPPIVTVPVLGASRWIATPALPASAVRALAVRLPTPLTAPVAAMSM